ncbi:uncharacterized protein BO66DRAFT_441916 [Aspergillus aculeatinus CBS 121060]|uniref:Uncharacterized protein n=1 Tax=Aspergillus aculeatinus CBS 121060 TaxID=1448322 RepID=A0ACD1GZ04_9EURO|nr:hypothetical protein BO66DRAFT_441916 [Aspergillus aculeatinus CBS 121060]RAH66565.1 hypothetical protein BO66DRAFT_441916 [Aspergillus aculeatinus CBS 121060]
MKQTYVCGLRQGEIVYGHESEHSAAVSVPSSKAAMIFTIEIHGLSQLEFVSEVPSAKSNKTMSDTRFRGVIYPQTKELRVDLKWDIFKIFDIILCDRSIFGHDFLWSSILPPARPSADSFYDWPRHVDFSTQAQRLMEYIPLQSKEGKLYGLTALCSNAGIVGIGTHFRSCPHQSSCGESSSSTHWYGRQFGCPIHFRLDRQETISSVFVLWEQNDYLPEPYLAVTTSKDETYFLGPYIESSRTCTKSIFHADSGDLQGLYYDKSPGLRAITSLGSIYQPHGHPVTPHVVSAIPPRQHMEVIDILNPPRFFSQAPLRHIRSLVACYPESRCTGLLLCYRDGTERILGQWYEDADKRPEYDALAFRDGSILRFYFAQEDRDGILLRVGIVQDAATAAAAAPQADERFVDMMEGVYWLFTDYADIIFAC